jgi:cytochrome d ubiquinol oxidase subunit I
VLSLLSYNQLEGEVKGIYDLQAQFEEEYGPGNYIPPVAVTYWSFRIMVGAGTALFLLGLYGLFQVLSDRVELSARMAKIYMFAIGLPYLANTFGWVLTEVGRLPWAVYGVLKLEDAISPNVSRGMILTSLTGFLLVYGVLMLVDVKLLVKYAKIVPGTEVVVSE